MTTAILPTPQEPAAVGKPDRWMDEAALSLLRGLGDAIRRTGEGGLVGTLPAGVKEMTVHEFLSRLLAPEGGATVGDIITALVRGEPLPDAGARDRVSPTAPPAELYADAVGDDRSWLRLVGEPVHGDLPTRLHYWLESIGDQPVGYFITLCEYKHLLAHIIGSFHDATMRELLDVLCQRFPAAEAT